MWLRSATVREVNQGLKEMNAFEEEGDYHPAVRQKTKSGYGSFLNLLKMLHSTPYKSFDETHASWTIGFFLFIGLSGKQKDMAVVSHADA